MNPNSDNVHGAKCEREQCAQLQVCTLRQISICVPDRFSPDIPFLGHTINFCIVTDGLKPVAIDDAGRKCAPRSSLITDYRSLILSLHTILLPDLLAPHCII